MPVILQAAALLMLSACHDHEPCEEVNVVAELSARYDRQWEYPEAAAGVHWQDIWPSLGFTRSYDELRPGRPEGLRTILYDDEEAIDVRNISSTGGKVYLWGEDASMLVFNNDTEFDVIDDTDREQKASVSTRLIDRPSFGGSPYARDVTILTTPPDVLYHCFIPEIDWQNAGGTMQLNAAMVPLVYTYAVRYGIDHGLEYVAMARGVMSGMSRGTMLWDGLPFGSRIGVAFDASTAPDAIEAYVHSFGHPYTTSDVSYGLNLEMRLKNGRYLSFDFDITEQMRHQPRGGVIMVTGIEIPDSIGRQPTGGGFDVKVDGWGEFEDIKIPL